MFEEVKLGELNESLLKELRMEAEMMERLSNHPNIVKFVGAVTQGQPCSDSLDRGHGQLIRIPVTCAQGSAVQPALPL